MRVYLDFYTVVLAPNVNSVPIEISLLKPDKAYNQFFNIYTYIDAMVDINDFVFKMDDENGIPRGVKIDFKRVPGLFLKKYPAWLSINCLDGMTYPSEGLQLVDIKIAKLILTQYRTQVSPETVNFYQRF